MKKLVVGILAHVDAGKTTLAEALLYTTGKIKKLGRVDRRDTFLDTHALERERGITIFSKQAILEGDNSQIVLLDTPGHVDFSGETERTLSVLDYAILVISGSEGVQAHTETLWHLLERYRVPTVIFVTKMDMAGSSRQEIMADLTAHLHHGCVDCSPEADPWEEIAMTDEGVLEQYMETGEISDAATAALIRSRRLFPCLFGSGLRLEGIADLLAFLERYTVTESRGDAFSARVYKISHDKNGARVTHMKITGGSLRVRQILPYETADGEPVPDEKITAIRFYSGDRFDTGEEATAGDICAVTGLSGTFAGQGLGEEARRTEPYLEPVLYYRVALPPDTDPRLMLPKLRELEEEEPLLHVVWNERFGEIHAQVMGQVQTEVLCRMIRERYDTEVAFTDARILYRETVDAPVEGVGHFEPLRHYAEVHLLLEPLPRGEGVRFDTAVDENGLAKNWQRLILTHLEEKQHRGVLTGAPVTDMKITLVAGRAHLKHTQGGDFRESTYRAVRHGLMTARAAGHAILLEPCYAFRLEVPGESVGRAISDIVARHGTYEEQEGRGDLAILTGRAPVSTMADYAAVVAAYSRGRGKFSCRPDGYEPCHNTAEVVEAAGYDPEADRDNPPDSVFCAHGAGFSVPWDQVTSYMHLEGIRFRDDAEGEILAVPRVIERNLDIDEKELEAIMEREFGPIRRKVYGEVKNPVVREMKAGKVKKNLYIIDGYNVIFAWEELADIAETDLENARRHLCDILANYQAFTHREMIVVFDAYNVKGSVERKFDYQGLHIVYTKEGELGDTYIEKLTHDIGRDYSVRVVTSDSLIQLQAIRSGVLRLSAREFREEILSVDREIEEILKKLRENG